MRTIFYLENGDFSKYPKHFPNISGELGDENEQSVKFPKRLKYRGKLLATIYGKRAGHPYYRLYWRIRGADGKPLSRIKDFGTYAEAKREGEILVSELARGSQVTALTPQQARDAVAALESLESYRRATGRSVSLLTAASEFAEASAMLHGQTLGQAVAGYLSTVATVKRKAVSEAVEEFLAGEELRTKAAEGKRPEVSPKYHYNRSIMLRRFAGTFPKTAVCELTKGHLDTFVTTLGKSAGKSRNHRAATSAKSRNHHRAAIRQFLGWAVRKDYLPVTNRLGEADGMRLENGDAAEIQFYTPAEFKALLDAAEGPLRAMIAIGGLAGLRTQELLRLTWEDVRRVENHIEVTSGKAKTRQRRLVEIVPALAQWLSPYAEFTGRIWTLHEITFQQHFVDLCEKARIQVKSKEVPVARKPNGLRHSFCTFHFALHGNENLTAQQAGNSPAMLHRNYKGLATRKEAEAWFAVTPAQAANVIPLTAPKSP